MPITEEEKRSPHFRPGISCPHCHDQHSQDQLRRYAERERQIKLAQERGETHIGEPMSTVIERRRQEKLAFKAQQRSAEAGQSQVSPE